MKVPRTLDSHRASEFADDRQFRLLCCFEGSPKAGWSVLQTGDGTPYSQVKMGMHGDTLNLSFVHKHPQRQLSATMHMAATSYTATAYQIRHQPRAMCPLTISQETHREAK
jgi:hypothetical protein